MAAGSMSVFRDIVLDVVGKHVDIIYSNKPATMKF